MILLRYHALYVRQRIISKRDVRTVDIHRHCDNCDKQDDRIHVFDYKYNYTMAVLFRKELVVE